MRSIRHMLRLKSYFNGIVSFNFPLPALFGIRNLHNHVIIGENVALTLQTRQQDIMKLLNSATNVLIVAHQDDKSQEMTQRLWNELIIIGKSSTFMTNKVPLCNEKTIQEGIQLSQRTGINAIIAFGNETIQHIAKGIQSEFFKRRHIYFPIIIIPTNLSSTIFDTRYKVLHSETDAYEDKDNFKALESQLVLLDTKLVRTFHSKSLEPLKLLLFGEYLDLLLFAKLHHREVTTPSQIKSLAVVSENFDCLAHVSLEISQLRRELCLQVCDQSPWFGLVEVYSHVLELLSIQAKGFPDANDITSSEALIRIFSIYQQSLQNQQSLDPIAEAIRQSIEDAQYKSEVNLQELLQRYRQLSKADLSRSASRSPMVHKQTSSISSSASSASSLMEGIIMLEKDKLRPTTPTERNIFATPNVNSNLKTSLKLKLLESNFLLDVVNA